MRTMHSALVLAIPLFLFGCPPGGDDDDSDDCGDDGYAPNASLDEAAATVQPGEWSWSEADLVLCPASEDWFSWDAETDCTPTFHLEWDNGVGDLDVQTFDADGNPTGDLGTDWGTGRTSASGDTETGFARVRRVDGGDAPLSYEMEITVDCLAG